MDTRGASGSNSSRGFTFYIDNSTLKLSFVAWNGSGSVVINIASTATISAGSWVHVAATRASGTWRLFINGNLENTGAESSAPGDFSGNLFNIGRSGVTATPRYFKGWIDELRVIHGRAQWTASFTPETSAYAKP